MPSLSDYEDEAARKAIRAALEDADGNVRDAADALDVHYSTLYRRMDALGISRNLGFTVESDGPGLLEIL